MRMHIGQSPRGEINSFHFLQTIENDALADINERKEKQMIARFDKIRATLDEVEQAHNEGRCRLSFQQRLQLTSSYQKLTDLQEAMEFARNKDEKTRNLTLSAVKDGLDALEQQLGFVHRLRRELRFIKHLKDQKFE